MFLFTISRNTILWPRHFHLPVMPENDNYCIAPAFRVVGEDDMEEEEDGVPSGLITLY